MTPEYSFVRNARVVEGRFIEDGDLTTRSRVCVIGADVADTFFPDTVALGQTIKIRNVPFRVVGVMERKGSSGFGASQDSYVYVPLTTAAVRLFGTRTASGDFPLTLINVAAVDKASVDPAIEEVTAILRERHRLTYQDNDFSVITQRDIINLAGSIIGILTIFLGAIAGISLLVGGIGIMNIMLASISERVREIGIRKSVGASTADIFIQILVESVVLAVLGGLVGLATSFGLVHLISGVSPTDNAPVVTPTALLVAFSFSVGIGILAGLIPAVKAARLDPIQALRYE